jgi:hypothetical protein
VPAATLLMAPPEELDELDDDELEEVELLELELDDELLELDDEELDDELPLGMEHSLIPPAIREPKVDS